LIGGGAFRQQQRLLADVSAPSGVDRMNLLNSSPEEMIFRAEVRDWLQTNVPRERRRSARRAGRRWRSTSAWQRKQFDAGWAGHQLAQADTAGKAGR